jgi:uncharacterized membrane protein YukC
MEFKSLLKKENLILGGVALAAGVVGFAVGSIVTKKKLEKKIIESLTETMADEINGELQKLKDKVGEQDLMNAIEEATKAMEEEMDEEDKASKKREPKITADTPKATKRTKAEPIILGPTEKELNEIKKSS